MKSIKPGRAHSFMGVAVGIIAGIFGIAWTIIAASMGGGLLILFGVLFIIIAVIQSVFNFMNATKKNRYSVLDITDSREEPDPLNTFYGGDHDAPSGNGSYDTDSYCPYCGEPVRNDYEYCKKCGKKLPDQP